MSESGSFENENVEINEEFIYSESNPGEIKIVWLDSDMSLRNANELAKFEISV